MKLADLITDYIHAACSGLWIQTFEPDEAVGGRGDDAVRTWIRPPG